MYVLERYMNKDYYLWKACTNDYQLFGKEARLRKLDSLLLDDILSNSFQSELNEAAKPMW